MLSLRIFFSSPGYLHSTSFTGPNFYQCHSLIHPVQLSHKDTSSEPSSTSLSDLMKANFHLEQNPTRLLQLQHLRPQGGHHGQGHQGARHAASCSAQGGCHGQCHKGDQKILHIYPSHDFTTDAPVLVSMPGTCNCSEEAATAQPLAASSLPVAILLLLLLLLRRAAGKVFVRARQHLIAYFPLTHE